MKHLVHVEAKHVPGLFTSRHQPCTHLTVAKTEAHHTGGIYLRSQSVLVTTVRSAGSKHPVPSNPPLCYQPVPGSGDSCWAVLWAQSHQWLLASPCAPGGSQGGGGPPIPGALHFPLKSEYSQRAFSFRDWFHWGFYEAGVHSE